MKETKTPSLAAAPALIGAAVAAAGLGFAIVFSSPNQAPKVVTAPEVVAPKVVEQPQPKAEITARCREDWALLENLGQPKSEALTAENCEAHLLIIGEVEAMQETAREQENIRLAKEARDKAFAECKQNPNALFCDLK